MKLELTQEESNILFELLGNMNYYDIGAILSKKHYINNDIEYIVKDTGKVVSSIYNKLYRGE